MASVNHPRNICYPIILQWKHLVLQISATILWHSKQWISKLLLNGSQQLIPDRHITFNIGEDYLVPTCQC